MAVIACLAVSFSTTFTAHQANDIVGEWYITDKTAVVSIFPKNGAYHGRLVWVEEPNMPNGEPKRDVLNPDRSKRSRTLMSYDFMANFKFDGQSTWRNGSIYNAEDGRTYSGQITLKNNNQLVLRGYIGMPILGRSVTWTRKK